jgi:hypothetical protein
VKKFACIYRHMGKEYCLYVRAKSFENAESIIDHAYLSNNLSAIDFDENFTLEQKLLRIRDAYFNGDIEQVVFTLGI